MTLQPNSTVLIFNVNNTSCRWRWDSRPGIFYPGERITGTHL